MTGSNGINPLKIYNAQGKEIVQTLNGLSDTNGGITIVKELALSMLETVRKPNTFYATSGAFVSGIDRNINDYYWTAYSRGTDGTGMWEGEYAKSTPNTNNGYLNGFKQLLLKSIFDPCPYGFRVPTNGSYNKFDALSINYSKFSYAGGIHFRLNAIMTWIPSIGRRDNLLGLYANIGYINGVRFANNSEPARAYTFMYFSNKYVSVNYGWQHSFGASVRCIEDAKKGAALRQPL